MTRTIALVLAALAAGCGGLGTPDLATGEVRGRVVGGTASGYVYPVGHPELKAPLAADGSFRVKAPVGAGELVLWDGGRDPLSSTAPYGRAGRLPVTVEAAEISEVGDQEGLPAARAILAGVRAESGAGCKGVRYRADLLLGGRAMATDQDHVLDATSHLLWPLPPGSYRLTVSMDGFVPTVVDPVDLETAEGADEDLDLEVDDDDDVRGCEVTGCTGGLTCCRQGDPSCYVGRCYDAGGSGAAGSCGAACGSGGSCEAGLSCAIDVCAPPGGDASTCGSYLAALGAACLSSTPCAALSGGVCANRSDDHAGYCTAACSTDADCAGFTGDWRCDSQLCKVHD